MYFNILKKDLKRKKTMNAIIFIFIVLCTTFMASSANNLYTTFNALDYFGEISGICDYYLLTSKDDNADDWVDSCEYVKDYERDDYINVVKEDIYAGGEAFQTNGPVYFAELPDRHNFVLDEDDERITAIKKGEVALSNYDASMNNLEIGDIITVKLDNEEKKFTVKYIMKDMAFGTGYMGMSRLMISDEDYKILSEADSALFYCGYSVMTDDVSAVKKDLNRESFSAYFSFDESAIKACYTMEMMVAAILIVVSIMLIVIAFVILHFTIGFTIQEDFMEIGIMKAIGLQNGGIKQVYVVKYSFLAVLGAAAGLIFSVPFGNLLMSYIRQTIAIEDSSGKFILNILCALFVILLVSAFCYLSTGKINRLTAMQAIRSGMTGERYKEKSVYIINRHARTLLPLQMAINDILSNIKSYVVLIFTFIIGTLLIILPLNMVNTLKSDNIMSLMGMAPGDVCIDNNKFTSYIEEDDLDSVKDDMNELEELYRESGVDIRLYIEYAFMPVFYTDDIDNSISIYSFQAYNNDTSSYSYTDGTAPILANELAMTESCMEELRVGIGDSVHVVIGDTTKSYIITASFQSMNNMGRGVRFSSSAVTDFKSAISIWSIIGNFENRNDIEGQTEKLKEITPSCIIRTNTEFAGEVLSSIIDTIDSLIIMILLVVLFINCLITVLLVRMFISKDSSEIALLKNIGFNDKSILLWQSLRIIIILTVSIIAGVLLSSFLNSLVVPLTFGKMGAANVEVVIKPLDVFLKYPMILLTVTAAAAALSALSIKSITFKHMGNAQ